MSSSESGYSSQPRLVYFISRPNGVLTPLIPADELPLNIQLRGVSRRLDLHETHGMLHIGMMPFTGHTFQLEDEFRVEKDHTLNSGDDTVHNRSGLTPGLLFRNVHSGRNQSLLPTNSSASQESSLASGTVHPSMLNREGPRSAPNAQSMTQPAIEAVISPNSKPDVTSIHDSQAHLRSMATRKKKYCTFWIRTGECDYVQQGCRYQHTMPDKATLQAIGFRSVPKWWQERIAATLDRTHSSTMIVQPKPFRPGRNPSNQRSDETDAAVNQMINDRQMKSPSREASYKQADPREPSSHANVSIVSNSRTFDSSPARSRKHSTDSDLITLTPPLYGSLSAVSFSSATGYVNIGLDANLQPKPFAVNEKSSGSTPSRIFVPPGESSDFHVRDARKRVARSTKSKSPPAKTRDAIQSPCSPTSLCNLEPDDQLEHAGRWYEQHCEHGSPDPLRLSGIQAMPVTSSRRGLMASKYSF